MILDQFEGDASNLKIYKSDENLKSFLALPLLNPEGNILGVLTLDSKESYVFSQKLQKIMTGFAEQIAWHLLHEDTAVSVDADRSWHLFKELSAYSRFVAESPQLSDLSQRLIQVPPEILKYDAIAVVELDEGRFPGRVLAHRGFSQDFENLTIEEGKGLTGSCAKNNQPIVISDAEDRELTIFNENEEPEPFQSLLVVPIVLRDALRGALIFACQEPDSLNTDDADRISVICASAGAAIYCIETRRSWQYDRSLDQITGAPNHRFLIEHREAIQNEILKEDQEAHFLAVQLTNLPSIYETHGTDCGDQLLRQMISMFSKAAPSPKYVFKYSDNTFLLILMERTRDEVLSLEARLRHVFENNQFYAQSKSLSLKTDLGLASYPADGKDLALLAGLAYGRATQTFASF